MQEIIRRNDVEPRAFYRTIGACDLVLILETQDERGMARTLVGIARPGANRTETLFAPGIPSPSKEQSHA